ncbi:FAD-dependent thymidylate synthase [Candidatus Uhrbacteria bacterium]|nr:FAD-dependent thymidylate synthase [Candidatus Uhrbacteria bacterium]
MPRFTPEEVQLLSQYVTDTESDVFAVKNLAGIVGAVYARYSRAPGGFRETLLKEFLKTRQIDAVRAQDLIARVLVAYGDDSVGELEGAHVSFENISVAATKEIEDRRIGGSPIEQSTRYVFYDQRDADNNFRYYRDPSVLASAHGPTYVETMDFIFSTYCRLIEPMQNFYRALKSLDEAEYDINGDGVKEKLADCKEEADRKAFTRTYASDIRTKACDSLRALLPIATKTNVGIFGNGRFFQTVLTYCYSSALPEARDVAAKTQAALDRIIPHYVKRAKPNEYAIANRNRMRAFAAELFAGVAPRRHDDNVHLVDRAASLAEEDDLMLANMLYPYLRHPLTQIQEVVRAMTDATKQKIVEAYVGERTTRRDRPGRALESGYPYTFDMVTDFGSYKDLERHRMMTQERQKFTPLLGFTVPADLKTAGFEADALECAAKARALYDLLAKDFPEQASYATLHGSLVRWTCGMNDREAMHLIELRTTPQGHPQYRKVCQAMHRAIAKRSPWRAALMKFADHNEYFWSRGDAEAHQRVKEKALDAVAKTKE